MQDISGAQGVLQKNILHAEFEIAYQVLFFLKTGFFSKRFATGLDGPHGS